MSRSLKLRSLLTTTSMVALLAAPGVYAAPAPVNPYGNTVDQLLVSVSSVTEITNAGLIQDEDGGPGILLDRGTVFDDITNTETGVINIDGDWNDDSIGILVYGDDEDPSLVVGGIYNAGGITVTGRDVAGIRISGDSYVREGVNNSGTITVTGESSRSTGHHHVDDDTFLDASSSAVGIDIEPTNITAGNSVSNTGTITVSASASVDQTARDRGDSGVKSNHGHQNPDAKARAEGSAEADATGIYVDHHGAGVYDAVDIGGTINVTASADSASLAKAYGGTLTCGPHSHHCSTEYGDADSYAIDEAEAEAYGVRFDDEGLTVSGNFLNQATITATATAEVDTEARATAPDDAAAYAGKEYHDHHHYYGDDDVSYADAEAGALLVDAYSVGGELGNTGSLTATATANATSTATANAGDDAYALARNATEADAYGFGVDVYSVGSFSNTGDISVAANATGNASANATADDRARAYAEVEEADAYADGIYFYAGVVEDDFSNSAELVSATATAASIADATASGSEYSEAHARGHAYANSDGIYADTSTIGGDFLNSGTVQSTALATGEQTATVTYDESLVAEADGDWITAHASGIYADGSTIGGSFINDGALAISATAQSISTATATGLDDVEATAGNGVSATAYGIDLDQYEIGGNVRNSGEVGVAALAEATQVANATATEDGEGDAAALAGEFLDEGNDVWAYAGATGLYVYLDEGDVGGSIINDGAISADATANIVSNIEATGWNTGDAWTFASSHGGASAYGIQVEDVDVGYGFSIDSVDDDYASGYFINAGSVSAQAEVNIDQTATSNADDGNAGAASLFGLYDFSEDGATARATGIALDDVGLLNGFVNVGSVYAGASAEGLLTANSSVDDGDETLSLALAGGWLGSEATGISLEDVWSEDGGFYNGSSVVAVAMTDLEANASAYSDDGFAVSALAIPNLTYGLYSEDFVLPNVAASMATGVSLDDVYLDEGFTNDGYIFAGAFAEIGGTSEAHGDEGALAYADNVAFAGATGVSVTDSNLDDIYNDGAIVGLALASVDTTAHAYADQAVALIGGFGYAQSQAEATGLEIEQYYADTVYNEENAMIIGLAGALVQNYARAEGWDYANASVQYSQSASATGLSSWSEEGGGGLVNDGWIVGGALSSGHQVARASVDSASGSAEAQAADYSSADATGAAVDGSVWNTGTILAGAIALSDAEAEAEGRTASAQASAHAEAEATALYVDSDGYSEDGVSIYNSGTIASWAVAQATATATAESEYWCPDLTMDAYAEAYAEAVGIETGSGSYVYGIANTADGVISANATASSTVNGESYYDGYARATGLLVNNTALYEGISNDGLIEANAQADGSAYAVGVDIDGETSHAGSLTNSGTIVARASGEYASATAIRLTDGGSLETIVNTGDILAYVDETNDGPTLLNVGPTGPVAIDARGSGSAVTIEQLGGHILGQILLENSSSDHIEWSGGTIQGDISGTYGEDGDDVLDIFAGANNAFAYADAIYGLDAVRLNDDASSNVLLRLTGSINNTNRLYVGSNATLSLSTSASVNVNDLTLASTGTLSYDLASDGTNAVINTTTADLGGGTVEAVFLDVQHPTTQIYRIINWDDNDSTFGTVTSNSLLQKVTALYGDDGVDLVVTKVSFGDLNNLVDDAQRLGHALDSIFENISLDSELGQALVGLIGLSPDEYEKAMNQIAGQQLADLQTATTGQLGDLLHVIQTQLSGMRGSQQASFGMNSLGVMVADNQAVVMSDAPVAGIGGPVMSGNWSAWARAFGDWASLKRDGYRPGFTSDAGGVVAGVDYKLSDNFLLGLAGGYQKTNMDFRGTGDGDITSWSLTAYGDYSFGPAYVDMLAGYSKQSYNLNRFLDVLGSNYTANSDYDGSSYAVSVETGYGFDVAANTKVTPFVGINYTHTDADSVTETGAGIWNLAYDSRSGDSVESVLGTRLSYAFTTEGGTRYVPTVELGWKHEYADTQPTTNAALAGTPGSNFLITGQEAARDSAIVGASLGVQFTDQIDGSVQYNGQYSSNYSDSTASVRLRLRF